MSHREPRDPPPSWTLSRRLFLQSLALVYGMAFVSLWVQIDGLIGSDGIAPAARSLESAALRLGADAFRRAPTLLWFASSDAALHALCALGVLASAAVLANVAPAVMLFAAWLAYLSLVAVGNVFLAYQWDGLLLEAGLLACFFAPWRGRRNAERATVPLVPLWALRWLLFRLVFTSGVAKLAGGDPTWRDLTALQYHYFTQPLPGPLSYFAHHLPDAIHVVSTAATLAIECGAPLLIFAPRRARTLGAIAIAALMAAIAVTGNFGFFNLATLCLCVLLLDDATLRAMIPAWLQSRLRPRDTASDRPAIGPPRSRRPAQAGRIAAAAVVIGLAVIATTRMLGAVWRIDWPAPVRSVSAWIAPLRSANGYGLFTGMTTRRSEIEVEGSYDGQNWRTYRFQWKPGRLNRMPGWSQPHMPRLDWQMWFAALGNCERNEWFARFSQKLLEGSEAVTELLEDDPFAGAPPRFVRSTLYRYRFAAGDDTGDDAWWTRRRLGAYCPVFTLEGSRLRRLGPDLGKVPNQSSGPARIIGQGARSAPGGFVDVRHGSHEPGSGDQSTLAAR